MNLYLSRAIRYIFDNFRNEWVLFVFCWILLTPRTIYSFIRWCIVSNSEAFAAFSNFYRFLSIAFLLSFVISVVVGIVKLKVCKAIVYIILYFLFCISIFLAALFRATISPSTMILLFETTGQEISAFFYTFLFSYRSVIVFILIAFLAVINFYLEKYKYEISKVLSLRINVRFEKLLLSIFLLSGFLSLRVYGRLFDCKTLTQLESWNHEGISYMDQCTNMAYSLYSISIMGKSLHHALENTKKLNSKMHSMKWHDDSCNVVLIIGESFIKNHSSLYGYHLNTNPFLVKERNRGRLFVFQDAISSSCLTSFSLKNTFSCNSIGDGEAWYECPFFPAIFKAIGYNVYFWDNQYVSTSNAPFDFSLNSYLHNVVFKENLYANEQGFVSLLDGELVDNFIKYAAIYKMQQNNLIIFHLQGQHFKTTERYPDDSEFKRFTPDSIEGYVKNVDNVQKAEIADYDNCTLYNDYVINMILSFFRNKNAIVVYFSDHGENVYDIENSRGRKLTSLDSLQVRQYYDIPFVVWCSDRYRFSHPDIINDLSQSLDRQLMTDNVCHLLMHLGGVRSDYYDPRKDVLSPNYKCPPRIVDGGVDYDKLTKRVN